MATAPDVCVAEIRDLSPATAYFFRVSACNTVGQGPWSEWTRMATLADVPLAPSGLRHVPDRAGSGSGAAVPVVLAQPPPSAASSAPAAAAAAVAVSVCASVVWQPAATRGAAVQQYLVEASAPGAAGDTAGFIAVYRGSYCGCLVKGLLPATEYGFRVAAVSVPHMLPSVGVGLCF